MLKFICGIEQLIPRSIGDNIGSVQLSESLQLGILTLLYEISR